jgi:hypothetical protein
VDAIITEVADVNSRSSDSRLTSGCRLSTLDYSPALDSRFSTIPSRLEGRREVTGDYLIEILGPHFHGLIVVRTEVANLPHQVAGVATPQRPALASIVLVHQILDSFAAVLAPKLIGVNLEQAMKL